MTDASEVLIERAKNAIQCLENDKEKAAIQEISSACVEALLRLTEEEKK
jgi:hypothetical protein